MFSLFKTDLRKATVGGELSYHTFRVPQASSSWTRIPLVDGMSLEPCHHPQSKQHGSALRLLVPVSNDTDYMAFQLSMMRSDAYHQFGRHVLEGFQSRDKQLAAAANFEQYLASKWHQLKEHIEAIPSALHASNYHFLVRPHRCRTIRVGTLLVTYSYITERPLVHNPMQSRLRRTPTSTLPPRFIAADSDTANPSNRSHKKRKIVHIQPSD